MQKNLIGYKLSSFTNNKRNILINVMDIFCGKPNTTYKSPILLKEDVVVLILDYCGFKSVSFGILKRCDTIIFIRSIKGYRAHFNSSISYQKNQDEYNYNCLFPRKKSPSRNHVWSMTTMSWVFRSFRQYSASTSSDKTVKLWLVETGECTRTHEMCIDMIPGIERLYYSRFTSLTSILWPCPDDEKKKMKLLRKHQYNVKTFEKNRLRLKIKVFKKNKNKHRTARKNRQHYQRKC